MALREGGILHSMLCAPRVPTDIEEIASRFLAIRTYAGVTTEFERKACMYGKDEENREVAAYFFLVPGTQNIEALLYITKLPDGTYGCEVSRMSIAEMTVYYMSSELIRWAIAGVNVNTLGYYALAPTR